MQKGLLRCQTSLSCVSLILLQGYRGVLCGSCEHDYGREYGLCRKCGSPALRAFILSMLVLWSLLFLSYFIRSVLQLATRIDFNKRFKRARTLKKNEQIEMTPIRSVPIRQKSSKGALDAYIEIIDASSSPSFLTLDWALSEESELHRDDIQEETNQPTNATGRVNESHAKRLASLKPSPSSTTEEPSVKTKQEKGVRNRGRLVRKLRSVLNSGTSGEDIEPLTLANPVSEILKVCISFSIFSFLLKLLWFMLDSCQLCPSDLRCCLNQRRMGKLFEKYTHRHG